MVQDESGPRRTAHLIPKFTLRFTYGLLIAAAAAANSHARTARVSLSTLVGNHLISAYLFFGHKIDIFHCACVREVENA